MHARLDFLFSILFLSACSSSSNNQPSGIAPDEGLSIVSNTLSSAASFAGDQLAKLSPRGYSITLDPKCSEHAHPLDGDGNALDEQGEDYASALFYCLMQQPGGGPDTLQGAIGQAAAFMCMLKDKLNFNGEPELQTMTLDGTCFPNSLVEEVGEISAQGTITTSEIGSPLFGNAEEWDYSVKINASPEGVGDVTLRLLVKSSDGLFAAAANDQVDGHENDGYSVYLDIAAGVFRYESKHQRYVEDCGDSCGWNRHNRMLITGTLESDGTFSDVSGIEAVNGNLYKSDTDPSEDHFHILSIKGNTSEGFFTHNFKGNGPSSSFSDFSSDITNCSGGTCNGNTGIEFSSASDLDFLMYPTGSNLTTTVDWFESLAPLRFTSVTTADSQL